MEIKVLSPVYLNIDIWYCSPECRDGEVVDDDELLQHNKQLLLEGLIHEARVDIVREGDGEALEAMWRIHMVQLWNRGHTHYKMIGHQFLACKCKFRQCVLFELMSCKGNKMYAS